MLLRKLLEQLHLWIWVGMQDAHSLNDLSFASSTDQDRLGVISVVLCPIATPLLGLSANPTCPKRHLEERPPSASRSAQGVP
jgi:hypothetical protein